MTDDAVVRHGIAIERLYDQTVASMTEPRGDLAVFVPGPIRVDVRCAPKGHRVGTVRATAAGLLWQGEYQEDPRAARSPEHKRAYLEDFPHMREVRRVFRMGRRAWDLIALFPGRPDPHRALALVCRCGDRGDVVRADLLDAARHAVEVHTVVVLIR